MDEGVVHVTGQSFHQSFGNLISSLLKVHEGGELGEYVGRYDMNIF